MGLKENDSILMRRILHAGYIFESSRAKIIFDPIFENPFCGNGYSYPPVEFDVDQIRAQRFDAVFLSHIHEDHFSSKSLNYLSRETPLYLYAQDMRYVSFLQEMGFASVQLLKIHDQIEIADISVKVLKALDESVDAIFFIQRGSIKILNVVDSWIHPEEMIFLRSQKWDLVLWPFQVFREWEVLAPERYQMENRDYPPELLESLGSLQAQTVIPSSCQFLQESWWSLRSQYFVNSYKNFEQQLSHLRGDSDLFQFLRLDPGETVQFEEGNWRIADSLSWVKKQELEPLLKYERDYHIGDGEEARSVSVEEISSFLPELSSSELSELKKRINSFPTDYGHLNFAGSYFQNDQIWLLRLWLNPGQKIDFRFSFKDHQLQICSDSALPFHWLTEISAYKLLRAMKSQELLNSLYLQVNGQDPQLDRLALGRDWDVLEDPLVQILSSFDPLIYQRRILHSF